MKKKVYNAVFYKNGGRYMKETLTARDKGDAREFARAFLLEAGYDPREFRIEIIELGDDWMDSL
jgi:hypothetical protein